MILVCVRDLLSARESVLEVKMSPEGGLHVPGLALYSVHNVDDVNEVGLYLTLL